MIVAAAIDWTIVLVAALGIVPATITAIGVLVIHGKIKTPSGKSIGKQVEDTLHTALANNLHLQAAAELNGGTTAPGPGAEV